MTIKIKKVSRCISSAKFTLEWENETYESSPLTGEDIDVLYRFKIDIRFNFKGEIISVAYYSNGKLKWKHLSSSNKKFSVIEIKTLKRIIDIEKQHNDYAIKMKTRTADVQKLLLTTIGEIEEKNRKINYTGLKKG